MQDWKKRAENYQAKYEKAERIPVTISNYFRILLLVYKKRVTRPVVLIIVLVFMVAFYLIIFSKTNDSSYALMLSIMLIMGFLIVFPPLWIAGVYLIAKTSDKHGFRKFDWLAGFD